MKGIATFVTFASLLCVLLLDSAHAYSPCPYFKLKLKQITATQQVQVSWKWVAGLKPKQMTLSIQRTPYLIQEPVAATTIENAALSGSFMDTPPQADQVYHYNTEVEVDGLYCQSRRYPIAFGNVSYRPGRGNALLYSGQGYCPAKIVQQSQNLINSKRGKKAKFKVNKKLRWGAQAHAAEMALLQEISSVGFVERIQETGYTPHMLVTGVTSGYDSAQSVVENWMSTPYVRKGILASTSITMGVACVADQSGVKWWALGIGQR